MLVTETEDTTQKLAPWVWLAVVANCRGIWGNLSANKTTWLCGAVKNTWNPRFKIQEFSFKGQINSLKQQSIHKLGDVHNCSDCTSPLHWAESATLNKGSHYFCWWIFPFQKLSKLKVRERTKVLSNKELVGVVCLVLGWHLCWTWDAPAQRSSTLNFIQSSLEGREQREDDISTQGVILFLCISHLPLLVSNRFASGDTLVWYERSFLSDRCE